MDKPSDQDYPLVVPGYFGRRPGIQIGTQLGASASEEQMQTVRALGAEWVMTGLPPEQHTLEDYLALKRRFEAQGLKIYRLANDRCHNMEEVTLNLPGATPRSKSICATSACWARPASTTPPTPTWATASGAAAPKRFAAGPAPGLRLNNDPVGTWGGKQWRGPLSHGRRYTEDELWENYTYFIRQVVPVAEESRVYIGIHPDDPPVCDLGGIPRCIFGTFAGYQRALEIAGSPNVGVCLCVGCWLEGGPRMGGDVLEAIRYFAGRKKLFKIHLRNISAPLPEGFVETFLDDGYMSMYRVVKTLHDSGFNGAVISDHVPAMDGGREAAEAFSLGYVSALIRAAAYQAQ